MPEYSKISSPDKPLRSKPLRSERRAREDERRYLESCFADAHGRPARTKQELVEWVRAVTERRGLPDHE
jgi:hypothetical protein